MSNLLPTFRRSVTLVAYLQGGTKWHRIPPPPSRLWSLSLLSFPSARSELAIFIEPLPAEHS